MWNCEKDYWRMCMRGWEKDASACEAKGGRTKMKLFPQNFILFSGRERHFSTHKTQSQGWNREIKGQQTLILRKTQSQTTHTQQRCRISENPRCCTIKVILNPLMLFSVQALILIKIPLFNCSSLWFSAFFPTLNYRKFGKKKKD